MAYRVKLTFVYVIVKLHSSFIHDWIIAFVSKTKFQKQKQKNLFFFFLCFFALLLSRIYAGPILILILPESGKCYPFEKNLSLHLFCLLLAIVQETDCFNLFEGNVVESNNILR